MLPVQAATDGDLKRGGGGGEKDTHRVRQRGGLAGKTNARKIAMRRRLNDRLALLCSWLIKAAGEEERARCI